jgi:hypothetical protein
MPSTTVTASHMTQGRVQTVIHYTLTFYHLCSTATKCNGNKSFVQVKYTHQNRYSLKDNLPWTLATTTPKKMETRTLLLFFTCTHTKYKVFFSTVYITSCNYWKINLMFIKENKEKLLTHFLS